MTSRGSVAVIGAGLAGLSAAWRLHRRGVDVHVFEAQDRVGGVVGTHMDDAGYLFERGPHSIRGGCLYIRALIGEAGLAAQIQPSEAAAKRRFIWRHGRLLELPSSPGSFLKSPILSARAKLRLLREPLVPRRRDGVEETLAQLFERRLGREAVEALVDPFVTGVFAGDPAQLGVDALPGLGEVEPTYGSFFGALRARGRAPSSGLYSLRGGLGQLPRALAAGLPDRVHLGQAAARIEPRAGGVTVHLASGDKVDVAHVIVATPARPVATLLAGTAEAAWLRDLPHPHVARIALAFRDADMGAAADGFGLLCPSTSRLPDGYRPILGAIFASAVFSGRAPAGHQVVTALLGGTRDPSARDADDKELTSDAVRALRLMMGVRGDPVSAFVTRWPAAIPQYQPGHARRVHALRAALPGGVHLAGNYLDGVSMDCAVASGMAAADAVDPRPDAVVVPTD